MKNKSKFTLIHRVLHWAIAISMSVLFITGFLRMYWMNRKTIVSIIQNNASEISKAQMNEIAISIREPMWQWHEIFAYIMLIAFIVRIVYMLIRGIRFPNPFKSKISLKERLQGFTYIYFYVFVFISTFTGICIQQELLAENHETIETIHKWGIYWFPIFIALHIIGIILSEIGDKKGITSKMIGGE